MFLFAIFVAVVVGFLAGALVFRKHGDRIEADIHEVGSLAKNVADTAKKL